MISYFKTQWLSILFSLGSLVMSIYNGFQANEWSSICWMVVAAVWLIISRVWYNHDRIKFLEVNAKKYDALCEEVKALYEANQVDRKYIDQLHKKITYLTFVVEDLKRGN